MSVPAAVAGLEHDLRAIFEARLRSIVAYAVAEPPPDGLTPTLVVVDTVRPADLTACAARVTAWQKAGFGTPLLLASGEFEASLDAFPLEFGAILADHVLLAGTDPFGTLQVKLPDLRRACEVQARSHLLHLREGVVEAAGSSEALLALVLRSAPALKALLAHIERLRLPAADATLSAIARLSTQAHFTADDAVQVVPAYLDAMTRLTNTIDRWVHA
jgi:hypothetical protein